jgi:hypothetical protein
MVRGGAVLREGKVQQRREEQRRHSEVVEETRVKGLS